MNEFFDKFLSLEEWIFDKAKPALIPEVATMQHELMVMYLVLDAYLFLVDIFCMIQFLLMKLILINGYSFLSLLFLSLHYVVL